MGSQCAPTAWQWRGLLFLVRVLLAASLLVDLAAARLQSLRSPFYNDHTLSYIKAYNDGQNAPVWDEMTCQSPFGKFPEELEKTHYTNQCLRRDYNQTVPSSNRRARLGVVVVVCREQLMWLREVQCRDTHLYVYSKCRRPVKHILDNIGADKKCVSVIEAPDNVWETLTNVKMHSDYLRHIVDRYSNLEPNLLFLKGTLMLKRGQRHIAHDLPSIVAEAMSGEWEFKAMGNWRSLIGTHFDRNPFNSGWLDRNGVLDEAIWGQELCTLYKRYTCESECYTCHNCHAPVCFQAHAKGMFMVSAERVRSLPRSEYAWLRQWLHSWDGQGIQRRFMMDVVWSLLFGCDADGHRRQTDPVKGCRKGQGWDMEMTGTQQRPPKEFLDAGQAVWPLPSDFYKDSFPFEPQLPESVSRLTFVAVAPPPPILGTKDGFMAMQQVTAAFLSAMLSNPHARLVLLHAKGTSPPNADLSYWAGKLELVELAAPPEMLWNDPAAYALALQVQYLQELAQAAEEPSQQDGVESNDGWVMLGAGVVVAHSLRPAFTRIGSSAGFVLTAPPFHPILGATQHAMPGGHHSAASHSAFGGVHSPRLYRDRTARHVHVDPSIWFVGASALARTAVTLPGLWERALQSAKEEESSPAGRVVATFCKEVTSRIDASSTVKTLTSRPDFVGLPCEIYAGRVGAVSTWQDDVCRISKDSVALKMMNSTEVPLVWSWMQNRGSAAYGVPRSMHVLAGHRKKFMSNQINAYENIIFQGNNQL
mmetsp:Transcript_22652/g.62872  ORF Transcript_22652/g.62872 Transcript_22652/m.62872 type:complete len:759 (-) Transcript_22652:169-2445(-)